MKHDSHKTGARVARDTPKGDDVLHDPAWNKGTAFTEEERDALGIRGLLPPRVCSQDEQVLRVMENFHAKPTALEKFVYMTALHDRNETLFFRVVIEHLEEMLPIIYTPTVGQACERYGHIFRRSRGLFISASDRGKIKRTLQNWPATDVRVIVITDGERILGLGDLGANGMGIPVGKLSLYTACAGVHPSYCLPITLDVGTENEDLLGDPLYLGLGRRRIRGEAYDEIVDEFVTAAQELFPRALIQFEDFANVNAFRLLEKYREKACAFNDDIQGTGAVALAGLISATRITGGPFAEQKVVFLGAGEAARGIADMIVATLTAEGLSLEEARRRCWFVDSQGLVVAGRDRLAPHKIPYAHEHEPLGNLLDAVKTLRPTAIVGVSGHAGTFNREVIEAMGNINDRPIIFALSNPTSKSECTAEQAYLWTEGRAVFASGSPFEPVTMNGKMLTPGQANNAYVFPGVGLGIVSSGAKRVTDEMMMTAAKALADMTSPDDLEKGRVFPSLSNIREISAAIATAVAETAYRRELATIPRPADLEAWVRSQMYEPEYRDYSTPPG